MLQIDYEAEGFPVSSPVANGIGTLVTNWNDILWSALTVGRPNRQHVFQHGSASTYEALFRMSLVRMAVEQSGPNAFRLRRTTAAKTLDPSEKGAVNYFMGMTICKLFASRLLDAPWMLHLDVFRPNLNPALTGRSRPDLIGQTQAGNWLAFESKGRASAPNSDAKAKAKQQALRCVSVSVAANNVPVTYHIGGIMYYRNDVLQFFWRDPTPDDSSNGLNIPVADDSWEHYYRPAFELVRLRAGEAELGQAVPSKSASVADVDVQIYPDVLMFLDKSMWNKAKAWCSENHSILIAQGFQPDGIKVKAGQSWLTPFKETGADSQ